MARLWEVMANTFMHKWQAFAGQPGSAMFKDWSKGLGDLTPEQIRDGVNQLPHLPPDSRGEYWPPTLPAFHAMCLPKADPNRVQTYSNRNFTAERLATEKALDRLTQDQPGDSVIAQKAKREMAAILANENTFEINGETLPVQTVEQSYSRLGLHARWNRRGEAQF